MGIMPAHYSSYNVLGGGQVSMSGSITVLLTSVVDTRRGGIAMICASVDVVQFSSGGAFICALSFNGTQYIEQMIFVGDSGNRQTVSKTWILPAPASASWSFSLEAWETGGDYRVNPTHTNMWFMLMR
jgi:hypothetical protein